MNKHLMNKDYLEIQRSRSRLSYWRNREVFERTNPELFKGSLSLDIEVKNPEDSRFGTTTLTPVYKVGTIAKILKSTSQGVKVWEERGWIPESTLKIATESGAVRGYTFDQAFTIWELSPLLNFSDKRGMEYSPFFVRLKEAWEDMPDGLIVI